jgi:hypothetical protein
MEAWFLIIHLTSGYGYDVTVKLPFPDKQACELEVIQIEIVLDNFFAYERPARPTAVDAPKCEKRVTLLYDR